MSGVVPQEDIKPVIDQNQLPVGEKPTHINIKVKNNVDYTEVNFRVRRSSQFSKLIITYFEMKNIDIKTYRFFRDGKRLDQKQTPDQLEMEEEGDQIDVFLEQNGGGRCNGDEIIKGVFFEVLI
ncbi:hypothetical protein MKW92_028589 [Papaver armeniacum]|nr:hypothetical protein MKW92_028589 [Papaver armeniacum]